jgi:hypothetical protein
MEDGEMSKLRPRTFAPPSPEITPVPTGSEVKWAAEPVWISWRRGANLVHAAIQNPNCPTHNLITKPITYSGSK